MRCWLLLSLLAGCGDSSHAPDDAGVPLDGSSASDGGGNDLAQPGGDLGPGGDLAQAIPALDLAGLDLAASTGPYGSDGPASVTTFTATVDTGVRSFTEHIYLPGTAGLHPVVSLSPGLQQTAAGYAPYGQRLASWGIVTLIRDDPGALTVTPDETANLTYVVATWLPAQNADTASMLHAKLNLTKVGLAGHSRGSQATLVAAENGLKGKIVAWFGINPVDSMTLANGTQARTLLSTIGIPTTYLAASVSSSCSPAADNYTALYPVAPSPAVVLLAVGAGHTQFEDPNACTACTLCTPQGTADTQTVLAYAVRYLTAFFARELLGDSSVGPTFTGAGVLADEAAGLIQLQSK